MQGIHDFIPTDIKVKYIQALLKVGYDSLDMGSFVSPKAIPQMRDTADVIKKLDLSASISKLLVIIANTKGAEMACSFDEVSYLGFPFSISETFQQRNTNASITEAIKRIDVIQDLCIKSNKELVVYISMAFGNPYGEPWDADIAAKWVDVMASKEIRIISLADTIGTSTVESIEYMMENLVKQYPSIEMGAHIHIRPPEWRVKIEAAYKHGCRRFDGAIKGFGGCPMASDDLVGNMPTEALLNYFDSVNIDLGLNRQAFKEAGDLAMQVFPS
jgi:hydroxymethylglutaryl-CoA lyase